MCLSRCCSAFSLNSCTCLFALTACCVLIGQGTRRCVPLSAGRALLASIPNPDPAAASATPNCQQLQCLCICTQITRRSFGSAAAAAASVSLAHGSAPRRTIVIHPGHGRRRRRRLRQGKERKGNLRVLIPRTPTGARKFTQTHPPQACAVRSAPLSCDGAGPPQSG